MTLKEGDKVIIDGTEHEVNSATPTGYGFMPIGLGSSYFWFIFKTKSEAEELFRLGRLKLGRDERITAGDKPCSWHSWQKYVGVREIYDFCTNCGAKKHKDWRLIKDEKDY